MAAPRKDNVKNIIMDTTEKLLNEHSLDDISLATIAKESGISKGTLYYHYKVKEDILIDIADRYLDEQWNEFLAWTENKNKDTSLHRLIKYVIERNVNFGPRIHLLYNSCIGNEEVREKIISRYLKFQKIISEKIAERTEKADADYIAWLILLVSDGLVIQHHMGNEHFNIDSFIKDTEEFVKLLQSK